MRVLEKVTKFSAYVSAIIVAFFFLSICLNILLRQVGRSVFGLGEMQGFLMPWLCFLAMPAGIRLGKQIEVDVVLRRLSLNIQRASRIINAAIAATLFMIIAIFSINIVMVSYNIHWTTVELLWPIWCWQLCLPIGFFLCSLESIGLIPRIKKGEIK